MKRLIALLVSSFDRNFRRGIKRKNSPERIAPATYTPFILRGERKIRPRPRTELAMRAAKMIVTEKLG
ncbi:MAG: hypothetical protein OEU80_12650, partial [Deltaproteobacteria bacterium]|nr:hypothetical protein [Deltaproteobacteria bacterium]